MITAKKAREIMPSYKVKSVMDLICLQIKEKALNDFSNMNIRKYDYAPLTLHEWNIIVDTLKANGFTVSIGPDRAWEIDVNVINISWEEEVHDDYR